MSWYVKIVSLGGDSYPIPNYGSYYWCNLEKKNDRKISHFNTTGHVDLEKGLYLQNDAFAIPKSKYDDRKQLNVTF